LIAAGELCSARRHGLRLEREQKAAGHRTRFADEQPFLVPLPSTPFRYYQHGRRKVQSVVQNAAEHGTNARTRLAHRLIEQT
jgi:hypothetical protein